MKKTIIFSCLAIFLYAQDDYVPLSELSDAKKIEYNFVDKKEKTESPKIKEYKTIDIEENKYETVSEIEEVEFKEDIVKNDSIPQKVQEFNKDLKVEKPIVNKDLVKEYKSENILQDTKNKTIKSDLQFTAQLTYSPLTSTVDSSAASLSKKSNILIPEIEFKIDNHKFNAEYFYVKNTFLTGEFESTLYKLGYKYNYLNANLGLNLNYLEVDSDIFLTGEEYYPSLEMDFFHNIENIKISYGLGFGKGNDIDYTLDYFFNAQIKPYSLSEASLIAGYKNRTIKFDDELDLKIDYKGPFIGVRSTF